LDEYVSSRLVIGYETYTAGGKKKWKKLSRSNCIDQLGLRTTNEGQQVALTLADLQLFVQQQKGDIVEVDVNCDSKFMLEKIPRLGAKLREAFHWVPADQKVYLVMDNAGGHGTDIAKTQYINILESQFNVEVVWQVPRSPETNMLDLGIWMSIQAAVTRVHHMRRCQADALAQSVEDAWNSYLSPQAFQNVFNRLRVVLACIVDDKGGNTLVESKRGKLFRDATIIDLTEEDNAAAEIGDLESEEDLND
jgi:hypothetical protein